MPLAHQHELVALGVNAHGKVRRFTGRIRRRFSEKLTAVPDAGVVAGLAWAGTRGIRRVEVSMDDGRTWTPAVLRRELAPAAWRQWRLPWRPNGAGRVVLRVRAVDGRGDLQLAQEQPPHPSGASGYDQGDVVAEPT